MMDVRSLYTPHSPHSVTYDGLRYSQENKGSGHWY